MILGKVLSGFLILVLFLCIILIYLRYIERHTLFHPSKEIEFKPSEIGLDFENIFFKTPDNLKLNGWLIPAKAALYTVLFCHGNAGNVSHRLQKINFFNQLGCNVFIFDYRGYGKSQGRPSEDGFYLDAKSAYDYLLSRSINPSGIIGYGESLGGAVIIDLASKNNLRALIVESSFSSGKDMARCVYPFIPYRVFSSRFDSLRKIKSITLPKLIIHSLNDEIVPYQLARRLFDSAPMPKEFLKVSGPHNSCFYDSEKLLKERMADFLNRLSK
jgi:hypothetical protein